MSAPYPFMQGPPMQMGHAGPNSSVVGPPGPQHMMAPPPPPPDPSMNNQPLQFNKNKGKPPMPKPNPMNEYDNQLQQDMDLEIQQGVDSSMMQHGQMMGNNGSASDMGGPGGNGQGMMQPNSMMGPWGPQNMMMGGMMGPRGMDQQMMMGAGWGPMNSSAAGPINQQIMAAAMAGPNGMMMSMNREPIVLDNNTTLYPPPPTAPQPSMRERPPGCRTIFIGGLPEATTEELLREIFDKCGEITSIRLSKKNFAHIRYEQEYSVEQALMFSGYRLKIENSEEKSKTGRLHVDYAQARDDLFEWECIQRARAREERHRMRLEQERLRPPSPPPVIHYSDHEAQILLEKVKDEECFAKASETLITWMERGDVNRRTCNAFYSMIQSSNAHVKRLVNEKQGVKQEFDELKQNLNIKIEGILRQLGQVEKVFNTASKQKAWDHFSKAQRKNMEQWRKACTELKQKEEAEFFKDRTEDEMEMSDDESSEPKKRKSDDTSEVTTLKEENTHMKFQIEAYKNEVMLLKVEAKELGSEEKDKQLRLYQQTMQGMQQQLLAAKQELKDRERDLTNKVEQLEYENDKLIKKEKQLLRNQKLKESEERDKKKDKEKDKSKDENSSPATDAADKEGVGGDAKDVIEDSDDDAVGEKTSKSFSSSLEEEPSSSLSPLTEREARLVGLISTFLHVHPLGASIDYIWSYLKENNIKIRTSEIEDLLEKCTTVFRQDVSGIGAAIEKKWKFIAFNPY